MCVYIFNAFSCFCLFPAVVRDYTFWRFTERERESQREPGTWLAAGSLPSPLFPPPFHLIPPTPLLLQETRSCSLWEFPELFI